MNNRMAYVRACAEGVIVCAHSTELDKDEDMIKKNRRGKLSASLFSLSRVSACHSFLVSHT